MPRDALLPKYNLQNGSVDREKVTHRVSEIFLRERMAFSLGLQQLDLFLTRIMNTLFQQSDKLRHDGLRILLNYDPQKALTNINHVPERVSDIIYLGNKGQNLVRLIQNGVPVPPGFIITTEVFRFQEIIDGYPPAAKNMKEQITREISVLEEWSKKRFTRPEKPLLLSVRSGAPISMPGMMDTFLNVGINEEIVQGIAARAGHEWFAWDCYRRFLQSYGMAHGLNRDEFDDIIADSKQRFGAAYKREFTGEQMKRTALAYKNFIFDKGIELIDSPFDQLLLVINKVFESWYSPKAKSYRRIMGISDDWGTAVTVQQMVFGNLSQRSGSGVVFTHNPRWPGDMIRLWGDFTLGNQGEDVVSGLVETRPISIKQANAEDRETEMTLEKGFPEIFQMIRRFTKQLIYNRTWEPQEIEFTFESPAKENLYFLQTRDMVIRERRTVLSFEPTPKREAQRIGHGIGVSGGAMAGRVVYSLRDIHHWRNREPETSLILIRGDTVPDDIEEIYEADGLLTARGGSTSHASIVAHRLGKTCVVGWVDLVCMEKESRAAIDDVQLKTGDWISIHGDEGSIYLGKMRIKETEEG
jgi:pyruvate,orthophosphate dikinase